MNTSTALVSIVIPSHNEGDDVLATVDCILRNSDVPLQLIVVDDSSTDHSAQKLQHLAAQGLIELARGQQLGAELALARLYRDGSEAQRDMLRSSRLQSMDQFCDRFALVN